VALELEDDDGVTGCDDEQPIRTIASAAPVDRPASEPRQQRTALMCARLFVVMGFIGTRECCRA
jgi:hypothetical protein